jgi:hypothetical protein
VTDSGPRLKTSCRIRDLLSACSCAIPWRAAILLGPRFGGSPIRIGSRQICGGEKFRAISQRKPETDDCFTEVPANLPFRCSNRSRSILTLASDGKLKAKVRYSIRGDQRDSCSASPSIKRLRKNGQRSPQMLALSDGFAGQVTQVTASDPYATKEPFTSSTKFRRTPVCRLVKKSPFGLPAGTIAAGGTSRIRSAANAAREPIKLGTPLAIELEASVQLPARLRRPSLPLGTSVSGTTLPFHRNTLPGKCATRSRSCISSCPSVPLHAQSDFHRLPPRRPIRAQTAQFFTLQAGQQMKNLPAGRVLRHAPQTSRHRLPGSLLRGNFLSAGQRRI